MTLPDKDRALLVGQLRRHENLKLRPYLDTKGKWTIGIGRNLTDNGVSLPEAYLLCENDVDRTVVSLVTRFPDWFVTLDPPRQAALVNMTFNLGIGGFSAFHDAIAALARRDYPAASRAMLDSDWEKQVGSRAHELAAIVMSGQWPGVGRP